MATRDIMAEIQKTLKQNPKADVTKLVQERGAKIASSPDLQKQYGDSQKELESRYLPKMVDAPVTQEAPQEPNVQQLRNDLLRMEESAKLASVARSSDQAKQAVQARAEAIDPKFRGLETDASVQAQLGQKRLKDIFAATGMAAGTGAAKQIGTEQALQGRLGDLGVQKAQEKAQVSKDLSDIASERAFIENQIRAGTATAETQQRLADLEAQQLAVAKAAEIQDERDYELYVKEIDNMNDRDMLLLKNSLEQENTILDAQIQELRDNRQFQQAQVLESQKSANNIKLQGIRDANSMARLEAGKVLTPEEQRMAELELQEQELRNQTLQQDLDGGGTTTPSTDMVFVSSYTGQPKAVALTSDGRQAASRLESVYVTQDDFGNTTLDGQGIYNEVNAAIDQGIISPEIARELYVAYDLQRYEPDQKPILE